MSREKPRNLAASVRQKLFSLAQERREDFGLVQTKYGLERFLYRLSQSEYRDQFVLKGALLFELWTHRPYRPTRDSDLSGQGDNSIARMKKVFGDVIAQVVEDDGLVFDAKSVRITRIKEEQEYEGLRVNFLARLERARISLQVDIGFGDAVVPEARAYGWRTARRSAGLEQAGTVPAAGRLGVCQPRYGRQTTLLARDAAQVLRASRCEARWDHQVLGMAFLP